MTGFGAGAKGLLWRDGDEAVDLSGLGDVFAQPTLNPLMAAGPRGVEAGDRRGARARRPARSHAEARCASRSRSRTTSTSTPRSSTRRTSAACSGPTRSRCCRTGAGCRSATTAAPAASSSAARTSSGRSGQRKAPDEDAPTFGPSRRLDFELELGFVVGVRSELGEPVPVEAFADHVFGVVLVNDWSARDIQAWEYVPLGPFLGKSFQTSDLRLGDAARAARGRARRGARAGSAAARRISPAAATGRSTSRSRSS